MSASNRPSRSPGQSAVRRLLVPGVAAAIGLAILVNLGLWQMQRLAWKEALIERVTADVARPAVPAPGPQDWPQVTADPLTDYRHVAVSGRYLPGAAYYYTSLPVKSGAPSGPGYMIYSPLVTEEGWLVMINRGFVPQGLAADLMAALETPPLGEQQLTGLLRRREEPNWTTPAVDTGKRIWFARDTDHMAEVLGATGSLAPYSIDLDAAFTGADGLPRAGETVVKFKNDHLGYALTWFGLAATLAGVFIAYAVQIFRRKA
ncbi:surfeit 1 [Pannonibacter phragmitetus]|uniref:SURF1 family protein n=1 Tax=Pannonibacter phragmitetus TaxID=121719 RepID=UPI0006A05FE8|nr:SURF1 family protein [Pannonibacter phragmitetus]KND19996.1 surfeit 1 [Pannonibacter phragmitetus]